MRRKEHEEEKWCRRKKEFFENSRSFNGSRVIAD